jgi:7-cyano-7-deazaguanine synthase
VHADDPETLRFAGNYKPLFVQASPGAQLIQITSQPQYFPPPASPLLDPGPVEIPPYSMGFATAAGELHWESLYPRRQGARRVLALCSGGLDATVAAWRHHVDGDEVTLLHVDYGCKARERERAAVERIAERMGRPAVVLGLDFFTTAAQSALTDPDREIQTDRGGEASAEQGHEWVPARNLVLLSLAIAYAEAHDFDAIALGTNLEESSGGYPDNEQEFVNKVARLMPYAVKPYCRVELSQPCGTLMKHEIVRLGHELGAPLELSWSCYLGGEEPCGTCSSCWLRRTAHEMTGLLDPALAGSGAVVAALG